VLSCSKRQEFPVAEAIHCPSCTTRYRLRPERLKPAIRRARCFTCGTAFPVGDVVQRLLAAATPDATAGFAPDLMGTRPPEPTELAAIPASSLTLTDLDSSDTEVPERPLITVPDSLPEPQPEAAGPYPPEITETTLSGYASARDAIEKLFGSTPPISPALKVNPDPSAMDLEATLSALESTLGASPVAREEQTQGGSSTLSDLSGEDLTGASTSTLRLSQQDLLAVIAAASTPAPAEPAAPQWAPEPMVTQPAVPRAFAPFPDTPDTGAELLRLKVGEDIYGGLTMPQLITWVGEGRILEHHLVARQHSENWLEAQKVPGLRPVFERLRRERAGSAPSLDSGISDPPPKKSLFGGLFGRN
jgi:predicted Zn finger-like uncharacterized protein